MRKINIEKQMRNSGLLPNVPHLSFVLRDVIFGTMLFCAMCEKLYRKKKGNFWKYYNCKILFVKPLSCDQSVLEEWIQNVLTMRAKRFRRRDTKCFSNAKKACKHMSEKLKGENMNIRDIIVGTNFHFNKSLGQNFISDTNLLDAIVADSGVTADDVVVEIGTGAGTLTRSIAQVAKRVISFEVDKNLQPVLALSLQGVENVEVVFRDVLKMCDKEFLEIVDTPFKVVANLPYYITSPLAMRFLESALPVQSLTIMVQKEVADRFVAKANTVDYSAITLAIEMAGNATITRRVSRTMFYPSPNVDSSVVRVDVDRNKLDGENFALVHRIVRSAFAMRRKTLANNISASFQIAKSQAIEMIEKAGFSPLVRGEALSLADFVALSHQFQPQSEIKQL